MSRSPSRLPLPQKMHCSSSLLSLPLGVVNVPPSFPLFYSSFPRKRESSWISIQPGSPIKTFGDNGGPASPPLFRPDLEDLVHHAVLLGVLGGHVVVAL